MAARVGTRIARPGEPVRTPRGSIVMETSESRASKRLCVTAFVVGDMVTGGVCSHVLGDITVKYPCESRFADFDERHIVQRAKSRGKNFRLNSFCLQKGIIWNLKSKGEERERDGNGKINKNGIL